MVAWKSCCRPTDLGGLGISDLQLAGYALQTRWLWLQQTDEQRAWSQLPISVCPQVRAFYKASTFTVIGNGQRTRFWEDRWIMGESVQDLAPCLYSIVPARIRTTQTVAMALPGRLWACSFSGGMSVQAIIDYLHLWHTIRDVELSDQQDRVVWRWTPDGSYTAKSAYLMLHAGSCRFTSHRLMGAVEDQDLLMARFSP
jgi:hypothetical protein